MGGGGNSAASDAANKSSQNQAQVLAQIQQLIGQDQASYGSNFAPILAAVSGLMGKEVGSASSGIDLQALLQNLASNPDALKAFSGIDVHGLVDQAVNYMAHPEKTSLSAITPGVESTLLGPTSLQTLEPDIVKALAENTGFYQHERATGLDPMVANNAMDRLGQQFAQGESDILAHLGPNGNPAAAMQALENQRLTASTNLSADLAAKSQDYMNTGAVGVNTTATTGANIAGKADEQSTINLVHALSAALGLDDQTAKMLLGAMGAGQQQTQQDFSNVQAGANSGTTDLTSILSFLGLGQNTRSAEYGALGGLNSTFGQQATTYQQMAQQQAQANAQAQAGMFGALVSLFAGGGGGG